MLRVDGWIPSPVEVVRFSSFAFDHQRMLTEVLIQRCGAALLSANDDELGQRLAQVSAV